MNEVQKQIGAKKKAKEDADDLMKQKADLEKEKKDLIESAAAKEVTLKKKIGTIGNIVHDSVPVHDNEVCLPMTPSIFHILISASGFQRAPTHVGSGGSRSHKA